MNRLLLCAGTVVCLACAESSIPVQIPGDAGQDVAQGASGGTGGSGGTGASGSGGTAGNKPDAGGPCVCGDPGCGSCPATPAVAAGGYRIDATEVSNGEYAAWLATDPDSGSQPAECAWNMAFAPSQGWPASDDSLPVVYVDHCDARAYCRWAKKRLCGEIGGGPLAVTSFDSASDSQWYNACSGGGSRSYPYGASYTGASCNGADFGAAKLLAVGSTSSCVGGYPALFDMSGNAWEWEDSCSQSAGSGDSCRIRGGSYENPAVALACDADATLARNSTARNVGFRCCSE